jgi:hypothetical protein
MWTGGSRAQEDSPMMDQELIARAQTLCRHRGIRFPSDLRQYAHQWQRERFDLEFCWRLVKPMLALSRPIWQAEVEIRRHHDRLQRDRDARDVEAGEPLETTPEPSLQDWWDTENPQEGVQSSASVPDDPDWLRPCEKPRQTLRARRQPYRKRTGTKAHKICELLKAHVVRRGPISVYKLERIAKSEGLLAQDQAISRSSSFRRVMKELNIESHRVGYGPRASYIWRLKPPAWTRELDVHG